MEKIEAKIHPSSGIAANYAAFKEKEFMMFDEVLLTSKNFFKSATLLSRSQVLRFLKFWKKENVVKLG